MNNDILFIACIVGAVVMGVFFLARMVLGDEGGKLRDRLGAGSEQERLDAASGAQPRGSSFAPILHKVGQVAAKPFMPKTREAQSGLRNRLGHAGIYQPSAVRAVQAAKVICLAGGLIGGYVAGVMMKNMLMGLSFGGLIGYLAPTFWLKHMVKRNQQSLNYGLPDALDLMVVCVEAGLTVDAAMQRVGQELSIAHPSVSREFGIAHMETRVGLTRSDALKNLGIRTGNAALQSLSAMLVQAERFGTSIATALRIHAETLRTNRQHAAEEMAAKASVKMSFPLVLFIFPSTFIVLAGPTVVQLMNANW